MKEVFLRERTCVYTCVYVSFVHECVCVRVWYTWSKPKRQRTFLKFQWNLLNQEMANSDQHYEILYFICEARERERDTQIYTFTQVSTEKTHYYILSLLAWIKFGQTKTYFTRQSISTDSTLQTAIFPLRRVNSPNHRLMRNETYIYFKCTRHIRIVVCHYCIRLHIFGKITL